MRWIQLLAWSTLGSFILAAKDCTNKDTCSSCIRTPNCMWCGSPGNLTDGNKELDRCVNRQDAGVWRDLCGSKNIFEPENYFEMLWNQELTAAEVLAGSGAASGDATGSGSASAEEAIVQLKPQRVAMKLRVQEAYSMTVTYRQDVHYPVDLYYLMDLSNSMEDDKESLSKLGNILADKMQNLTRDFKLGFGSFVDKIVMPYVSTVPSKLNNPCSHNCCAAPYGFRNALPLTTNASRFVTKVSEAPISGNLDGPEGGFDAIMQAIVCQSEIGWRNEARRLLVFSTDAGFHYAGDGKLGGIVKPNDGECHMDSAGEYYTHSKLQDYPSVSQINHVAKSNQMHIIFAVTQKQTAVYSRLAQMIEGSYSGELTANSSNVLELVEKEYKKITSKVELKDNATKPINIRYFSKCLGEVEKETFECKDLIVNDTVLTVDFRIEITVEKCPENREEWNQIIRIYPVGLRENLTIDLEMLCDCQCERPGDPGYIPTADACNGKGTFMCGVCACDEGFFGRACECDSITPWSSAGEVNSSACREPGRQAICSSRGECSCGECRCKERPSPEEKIYGKYCQCTNFLCDRHNGLLCSGPDHGKCVCNQCECEPGWKGPTCNCEDSHTNCTNPENGLECSDQGKCECNRCKCFETVDGHFSGKWCEDCPPNKGKCEAYKPCVQCQIFKTGELTPEECNTNCSLFKVTAVPVAEVETECERLCTFFDDDDCRFTFVYGYNENKEPVVRVQQTLECPPKLDILGIVLGVIGAIVAIGVALLLMWKVLTTVHDRQEFARFEKERMMAKWDTSENPIYKQATSTFKNPTYSGM